MRIVIDMQGAQTESRFRGIGRYTMSFAQAVARNRGEHEVFLALSGLFPDTIDPIRAAFDGLLSQESIRVWHAPGPVNEETSGNEVRREQAELIREAFITSLQPDVIHVSSLFEGYVDDAVTSIGRFDRRTPVSVSLYDLIPLLDAEHYLDPNPQFARYYHRKIEHLKNAQLLLAISDFACQESVAHLGLGEHRTVNVSTAIEASFRPEIIEPDVACQLEGKFGLGRPFILYAGGADERKNLPRLIVAYAALPERLRDRHQLVFAGRMPEGDVIRFKQVAQSSGLKSDELVFTGYVTDEELVKLYNLCQLYVFASWHEGFGLPALEAMSCGAPVIGANTSSLPEVIGLTEALFDPFNTSAIAEKITQALEDDKFRSRLSENGREQARKFSWDETAKRALTAWEALPTRGISGYCERTFTESRLYQALRQVAAAQTDEEIIALSNCLARNKQAGRERQLFVDVSELCQRDAATGVQRVVRSYLKWMLQSPPAGFRVEPVYATLEHGYCYARRFTQWFLGEAEDQGQDDPIRWQRGDIFFGLDMQHHVQLKHSTFYRQLQWDGVTVKFLLYDLLPIELEDLFKDSDAKQLHENWLRMIASSDGTICISKATADAFSSWANNSDVPLSPTFGTAWVHIGGDIEGSRPSRGFPDDAESTLQILRQRPSFLCVSTLEPRKRQTQILDALEVLWSEGTDVNLVFVGQRGWKADSLVERLSTHEEGGKRLFWLKGISDEYLEKVYMASACLIAASLNEGFGLSLIEAARHGLPIIARDIPVFREVAGDHAYYFSGHEPHDLANALKSWLDKFAAQQHPTSTGMLWSTWQQSTEKLKKTLIETSRPRRQLLVDVSELVQHDARTGIQAVVRNVLHEWVRNPPDDVRVEPVYATVEKGYRYARNFMCQFVGLQDEAMEDPLIEYAPGDIFFGLDLQPQVQTVHRDFYRELRAHGVRVEFLVHDLLCIEMPQYFVPGSNDGFRKWLQVVAENDGAICVSETTSSALATWIGTHANPSGRNPLIKVSHNGADNIAASTGLPPEANMMLEHLRSRYSFLMVGTLEPRKGHEQVLDAFEHLWESGKDCDLVFVGKQGWLIEPLVERLHTHPELRMRLFWIDSASDEYLGKLYEVCSCLIAGSYGEGFGLPLIEAAKHKLPIIARDIPVFREVAGNHAFYFSGTSALDLSRAVQDWIALYEENKHNRSEDIPWISWAESANRLSELLIGEQEMDYAAVPTSVSGDVKSGRRKSA